MSSKPRDYHCDLCDWPILFDHIGRQITQCRHHPYGPVEKITEDGHVERVYRGTDERVSDLATLASMDRPDLD